MLAGVIGAGAAGLLAGALGTDITCGLGSGVAGAVPETTSADPASFTTLLVRFLIIKNSAGNTCASTAMMKTHPVMENAVPAMTSMTPKMNGIAAASEA